MATKIVKHGHKPELQKFAVEFRCPYCHCDFYADDTFDSIYKNYYTTAANFELRYACPECGETANKSILRIIMKYSVNQHFLNG